MERKVDNKTYSRGLAFLCIGVIVLTGLFMSGTTAAYAQTCLQDKSTLPSLNCTANDVRLSTFIVKDPPAGCVRGSNVSVTLRATLVANSQDRYDIGMFIALDGGNALTGTCHQDYLPPPLAPTPPACTPPTPTPNGPDLFYNAECTADPSDTCGDLKQGVETFRDLIPLTVVCQDSNNDGLADVNTCATWDNNASSGTQKSPSCLSADQTLPSTASKCRCETISIGNIVVLGLTLTKTANPIQYDHAGQQISYSYVVTNTSSVELTNLAVIDDKAIVTCPSTTLAKGASVTCTATYTITQDDFDNLRTITNTANAAAYFVDVQVPAGPVQATVGPAPSLHKPNLTLAKSVSNTHGGTAAATDWTLSAAGPTPISGAGGVSSEVNAGAYTLSESAGPSGYTPGSWVCTGGGSQNGNQITLGINDTATCTIINSDKAATLIVKKVVINDNGGTKTASNFSFQVNGGSSQPFEADGQNELSLSAGTYTVTEPAVAGYSTSYDNCSNLAIPNGGSATCTITNNDQPATLIVKKHVVNSHGGSGQAGDFTLNVTGGSPSPASFSGSEGGTTVTLNAGSYSVAESALSGYAASYSTDCSGTITNGETKTCTVTNNDQAATLIVKKHVINDNGGSKQAGDFTMSVSGSNASPTSFAGSEGGTTVTLNAGSYTVDETTAEGYTKSIGSNCSGTIANGETKTCTITNDDQPATLVVIKHVINDNDGTAQASAFTMTVTGVNVKPSASFAGSETGTTVTLNAGSYSVGENGPGGYNSNLSADCSGTIANGVTKTCTITNDDIAATLIVIKHVVNNNGGTAVAGDFTMSVSGNKPSQSSFPGAESPGTTIKMNAGAYTVGESGPGGYSSSLSADCSGSIAVGQTKTCTITNDDIAATLTVVKHVVNDNGGLKTAGDFTLSVTGGSPSPASFSGSEAGTTVTLNAGSYSVAESALSSYTVGYSTDCSGSITVGQTKTCTVTNDDKAGTLIVKKIVINNNGGTRTATNFTFRVGSNAPVAFLQDPDNPLDALRGKNTLTVNAGTYTITEPAVLGYSVTYDNCTNVFVPNGGTQTCIITNDDIAPTLTVQKVCTPDTDPGRFKLLINGTGQEVSCGGTYGPVTLAAGSHTVSEQAGTNTNPDDYSATIGGDCAADGSVLLAVGEEKTCTITNKRKPQLQVTKVLIPNTDPGKFNLLIDSGDATVPDGDVKTVEGVGDKGTTGFVNVPIGVPLTVSETGAIMTSGENIGQLTNVGDYAHSITCSNGSNNATQGQASLLIGTLDYGDKVTCTIANVRASSTVTDSSLCALPNNQFNLLYVQDTATTYRLNASNPGQFYDNVFYKGDPLASQPVTLSITIPYPFVTQGAVPIQVHSLVSLNENGCFLPAADVTGEFTILINGQPGTPSPSGAPVILLSDHWDGSNWKPVTVTVTGNVPKTGLVYVTIHMDYGLKPTSDPNASGAPITTEWRQGTQKVAIGDSPIDRVGGVQITSPQEYWFAFSVDNVGPIADGPVESVNTFKQSPGFAGSVTNTGGYPVPNVEVQLLNAGGAPVGTAKTDEFGAFMFAYKYTGKATTFTLRLPAYDLSQTIAIKSNGFVVVNFSIP